MLCPKCGSELMSLHYRRTDGFWSRRIFWGCSSFKRTGCRFSMTDEQFVAVRRKMVAEWYARGRDSGLLPSWEHAERRRNLGGQR
jgi:hypothetical protein